MSRRNACRFSLLRGGVPFSEDQGLSIGRAGRYQSWRTYINELRTKGGSVPFDARTQKLSGPDSPSVIEKKEGAGIHTVGLRVVCFLVLRRSLRIQ